MTFFTSGAGVLLLLCLFNRMWGCWIFSLKFKVWDLQWGSMDVVLKSTDFSGSCRRWYVANIITYQYCLQGSYIIPTTYYQNQNNPLIRWMASLFCSVDSCCSPGSSYHWPWRGCSNAREQKITQVSQGRREETKRRQTESFLPEILKS